MSATAMTNARRSTVSGSVLVALVAALASCTDAATIVLKVSDNTILKTKGSGDGTATSVLKASSAAFNLNALQNFSSVANFTDAEDEDGTSNGGATSEEDALSAVWYLAAFGGLVLFFFVVTCSELFFGNPIYTRRPVDLPHAGYLRRHVYGIRNQQHHHGHYAPETPPPPYHLFAPPSYDDTVKSAGSFAVAVQQQHHQHQHQHQHHQHQHHLQQQQLQYLEHGAKKLADVYVVPVHRGGPIAAVTPAAMAAATTTAAAVVDAKPLAAELPPTKFK